jgi:class 3 adenylate cyclase
VVVLFCDLRGFTSFSAEVAPEGVMSVLSDYYESLGQEISRYAATLVSFSGDGLMVLVNAPVPVAEPALRALDLAIDMQRSVQKLIVRWRTEGYRIGFGVGLAGGPATVGRIGYESRFDYTAIGSVVNLAARLCASATDREILMDTEVAGQVGDRRPIKALGNRSIKGYEDSLPVFGLLFGEHASPPMIE